MDTVSTCKQAPTADDLAAAYRENATKVRGYLYRAVRSRTIAEDLTTDTFMQVLNLKFVPDNWLGLLFYLARLRVYRYWQWMGAHNHTALPDDMIDERDDPLEEALRADEYRRLYKAIDRLPPTQRRVINLRYFGQMPRKDVAQAVGITDKYVSDAAKKAIENLRRTLSDTR